MFYDLSVQQGPIVNAMKQQFPEQQTELLSVLKEISKSFINWRYSHEGNLTSFPTAGPLFIALQGRIKLLKPEW